jgi:hypothetical protein
MNENVPAEKIRTTDTKVTAAARKRYGSLRKAMVTAGFQISPRRRTAECVIVAIRTRYSEKENSEKEKIGLRGFGDERLAVAATQFFGSWAEAIEAAGLTDVSERLKGASARRFKRGQFDRKGMVHSDSGFLCKPSTGVGTWYVVWIWIKRRELSSYSLQG